MLFQKRDATSSEESKAQSWTNCLQTNPLPLELIARLGLEQTENQLPVLKTPPPPTKPTMIIEFLSIKLIQASDKVVTAVNWYGNKH